MVYCRKYGVAVVCGLLLESVLTSTAFAAGDAELECLRRWVAPWQQVKCVRVIWDLDLPLADVAANGWKAGRTVAIVRTRWPDGMLFDMTDTVVRKPFLPS